MHIVVLIVSLSLASYLASVLVTDKGEIAKSREQLSKTPLGGFNKFASDIQWMFFINYCGSLNAVNTENANIIYEKLDRLLKNDPDFEKAYRIGGMMLSIRAPMKAVDILSRGANNKNLENNWKLPFLAGYVLFHNVKDEDNPERLKQAEEMFAEAVKRCNSSEHHVVSSFLRAKAKRFEKRGKIGSTPVINEKHAYLLALYDEWNKQQASEVIAYAPYLGTAGHTLSDRMLETIQQIIKENKDDRIIMHTVDKVVKRVLKGKLLCPNCMREYQPGDKYCCHCGQKLKECGTCKKCGAILKGKFCSQCGTENK